MTASTQITNTEIFAFLAVLVFNLMDLKVLFINRKFNLMDRKVLLINRKNNRNC